jgi:hypothetical protein
MNLGTLVKTGSPRRTTRFGRRFRTWKMTTPSGRGELTTQLWLLEVSPPAGVRLVEKEADRLTFAPWIGALFAGVVTVIRFVPTAWPSKIRPSTARQRTRKVRSVTGSIVRRVSLARAEDILLSITLKCELKGP